MNEWNITFFESDKFFSISHTHTHTDNGKKKIIYSILDSFITVDHLVDCSQRILFLHFDSCFMCVCPCMIVCVCPCFNQSNGNVQEKIKQEDQNVE